MKLKAKIILIFILLLVIVMGGVIQYKGYNPFNTSMEIEAGSSINKDALIKKDYKDTQFTIDHPLTKKNLKTVGKHTVTLKTTQKLFGLFKMNRSYQCDVNVKDTTQPVIHGVKKSVKVPVESTYAYKKGVTTTDNSNGEVTLTIDNSGVNLNKIGTYKVIYQAEDASHNKTSQTMELKVYQPDNVHTMHLRTLAKAEKVLVSITNSNDSEATKIKKAFEWTRHHAYAQFRVYDASKKWPSVYADDYFDKGRGDCHSGAAAFAYLCLAMGKKDVVLCTDVSGAQRGAHSWAEIDGLCYDPLFSMMKGKKKGMAYNFAASPSVYSLAPAGSRFPLEPKQ